MPLLRGEIPPSRGGITERIDKFGNSIYDKTWQEMCRNARILERLGYKEAKDTSAVWIELASPTPSTRTF